MAKKQLLNWNGRPAEIGAWFKRQPKNPKWRPTNCARLRFLDGLEPKTEDVAAGKLKTAKKARPAEALLWRRVDDLIHGGMEATRATEQAKAELAHGILSGAAI